MSTRWETVAGKAVLDGRTLAEWVPDVVRDLVDRFDPIRVILFGSVARGDDGRTATSISSWCCPRSTTPDATSSWRRCARLLLRPSPCRSSPPMSAKPCDDGT